MALPGIFNPAEAVFDYIKEQVIDLFDKLVELIEGMIINPPRPDAGGWKDYIFGNVWLLAQIVSVTIVFLVAIIAIIATRSGFEKFLRALIVTLVIALCGGAFYYLAHELVNIGDSLAKGMSFYEPSRDQSSTLFSMPAIDSALGAIVGFGAVLVLGTVLGVEVLFFELISISIQIMGLLLMAFYMFGRGGQTMWRWTVSIGLVSMVFGRAAMVLCLEIGQAISDNVPAGNTAFGAAVFTVVSLLFAIIAPVALVLASNVVLTQIQGGKNKSTVEGNVNTKDQTPEQRKDEERVAYDQNAATMRPVTIRRPQKPPKPPTGSPPAIPVGRPPAANIGKIGSSVGGKSESGAAQNSTAREAAKTAATAVATKAASKHPAGAAAVVALHTVNSNDNQKKG